MLISLHLPKTAGKSFGTSLQDLYGDNLLRDYGDLPINTPPLKRNGHAVKMCVLNGVKSHENVACVHGHFLPLKYLLCKGARFVTWLRDPIERLASHYFYWLRNYRHKRAPLLHRKVVEEKWSLERFCLSPELRNFYSRFLWGFPIGRFDFIGITEHFERDMAYFSNRILGTPLRIYSKNNNPDKKSSSYFEDGSLRRKVERYHSKDVSLYKRALDMRMKSRGP